MRIRTAIVRPIIVDRAEIILQKRTWLVSKDGPFSFGSICKKLGTKLNNTQLKMLGKAPDIRRIQNRMDCLTAIGALGAVDFPGYFPIEIMDRKINTPDREIRSFEKAAECPVGLFSLLRELLNSLDVGFKFHISESRTLRLTGSRVYQRSGGVGCSVFLFLCMYFDHSYDIAVVPQVIIMS